MDSFEQLQSKAVDTLFHVFEDMCEGAVSVDKRAKVAWINSKYASLLGLGKVEEALGRDIEEVIPESMMRDVIKTGRPILLDIMKFNDQSFVVTRLPLHDDNRDVIGAIGFVLYDNLNYLKPLISKFETLKRRLKDAEKSLAAERRTRYCISNIVGCSNQINEVKNKARLIARHDSPVLILGETGTGKELLAQSIHSTSLRRDKPFVAINVAAIPETLLEAEFFGVSPGAFTGAGKQERRGKFALADGGTLFLDEIGDMPLQLQAKLLRVLEEKEYEAVGSNKVHVVDTRVIAATAQDLEAKVLNGTFRKDLYYRLNVLFLHVPPLRNRLRDIKPLCELFLEQIASRTGGNLNSIESDAIAVLEAHNWPGNVRELRNTIERTTLEASDNVLKASDVHNCIQGMPDSQVVTATEGTNSALSLPARIACVEKQAIQQALKQTSGKKAPAARLLGISRSQLYDKLQDYGLTD